MPDRAREILEVAGAKKIWAQPADDVTESVHLIIARLRNRRELLPALHLRTMPSRVLV